WGWRHRTNSAEHGSAVRVEDVLAVAAVAWLLLLLLLLLSRSAWMKVDRAGLCSRQKEQSARRRGSGRVVSSWRRDALRSVATAVAAVMPAATMSVDNRPKTSAAARASTATASRRNEARRPVSTR
ncbi:unnamed protein product, partial [Ectocarpus sp. 8 AP-2014]